MKNFKKLLTLMVALIIAFTFTACDKKEEDAKKEAEEIVEEYADAALELDFDSAKKYLDEDAKAYELIEEIEGGEKEVEEAGLVKSSDAGLEIKKDYLKNADYEIVSSEYKDDKVSVVVKSNVDFKTMKFDFSDELDEYFQEMLATELDDETRAYYDTKATVEELDELYVDFLEEAWKRKGEEYIEELKNADMEEYTFELEKDGDDWKITKIK